MAEVEDAQGDDWGNDFYSEAKRYNEGWFTLYFSII